MDYLGYAGALCIGLVLGLTGAGGSILTVPILVYLMAIDPVIATGYSLFVVGMTSTVGALQNFRKGLVDFKTALLFAVPSFVAVFIARRFIVPAIPETIAISAVSVSKDTLVMVLFALVMLAVAASMLRINNQPGQRNPELVTAMLRMFIAGLLIGFVGAGGGFLFIPVLLYVARLPMRKAVGTSLVIIALNSLIGFTGDIGHHTIDWPFLAGFTTLAIIGILIGTRYAQSVDEKRLKRGFAWFVLAMALCILIRECLRL